jgi:DNA-binding response OmpR family regulator
MADQPVNVPPVKILHVDDDEGSRYAVSRSLRKAGFEVVEAATGQQALDRVGDNPDLVVLDVRLPDIDGFEVCRRIKADPATADLPVLHLSASFTSGTDKATGLDAGADAYLVRPVEPVELVATVNALLRQKQAEDVLRRANAALATANASLAAANAALRASEARARFLSDLGEGTRDVADPEAVMAIVARRLGEHLGVSRCAYADVEPDGDRFTIRHDYTVPGVASSAGDYRLTCSARGRPTTCGAAAPWSSGTSTGSWPRPTGPTRSTRSASRRSSAAAGQGRGARAAGGWSR